MLPPRTQGNWSTIALVYLIGLMSMALVGILSPLALRITEAMDAPAAAIGLTIALFSLPATIVATVGGGIVDRLGPRLVLLLTSPVFVLADVILWFAQDIWLFNLGVLMAGVGYLGILNGGAAMLMGSLEGGTRTRALTLWSTYAPTGFSLGLLMAAPFTTSDSWRLAIAFHGAIMLGCAALAFILPHVAAIRKEGQSGREKLAALFAGLRRPPILMLGFAMAMPAMISYGTSLAAPTYLAKVHGVSLAASASIVAIAKIAAVLLGGTITGALLSRDFPMRRLLGIVVVIGIVAQIALFLPSSPMIIAIAGLMAWLFTYGAATGICMATMPALATGTVGGGTVAGSVNQFVSLASFLTPTVYFALTHWSGYVGVAIVGLLVCFIALPRVPTAPKAAASAA
ncbi:MFS family permease [Sphingobium sp. B1D7B]|uniref:MFS transporter n=1 Tax=unclassified Sphingobium TaxID=2611147 RepID=UPI002225A04E|nr:MULTISPECIES: MFS transporter [unclassified Sphingobium]MCW2392663.1 MFS family permease [Sphingobium sp. B11D3A]MCW2404358.1 MFS family permease [Sphingobium sp. B1D7B]